MPLDFPSNPINGQTYDNYYWDASSNAWRSSGTKAGLQPRVTALELADATTNKSGLVPIVPPTVNYSGGTATANTLGVISFSAVTSISLNNIFTSTYKNYRIIANFSNASASGALRWRTRVAGADYTGGQYYMGGYAVRSNATSSTYTIDAGTASYCGQTSVGADFTNTIFDIFAPQLAQTTGYIFSAVGHSTNIQGINAGGVVGTATQYDGITIFPETGNFTGTIQVFGYNS